MPLRYSAGGRSVATAATANHVAAQLWNPSTDNPILVVEIRASKNAATADAHMLSRSTARGATPTATVTPDIDSQYERLLAPPSASVLELATFGTQPTLATPPLEQTALPAAIGAGYAWMYPQGILVQPGFGLCIATPTALALVATDFTFIWDELTP